MSVATAVDGNADASGRKHPAATPQPQDGAAWQQAGSGSKSGGKEAKGAAPKASAAAAAAVAASASKTGYQKPKPQANVMLSDLFSNLSFKPAKAKGGKMGGKAESGESGGKEGVKLSVGHRQVKENNLTSSKTTIGVSGLGPTQTRGKEKAGPKKVRLSKMKKTILRELMQRHGLLKTGKVADETGGHGEVGDPSETASSDDKSAELPAASQLAAATTSGAADAPTAQGATADASAQAESNDWGGESRLAGESHDLQGRVTTCRGGGV